MKKFKEFKTEQKYIAEIGPIGALIGAVVGGIALYKGGKGLWDKIQGWKERKGERKDNKANGVFVKIKKWDDKKGKIVDKTVEIAPAGTRKASMSNEDIEKERKKLQKKEDPKNTAKQNAYDTAEQEAEDERDGIEDVKDAEAAYTNSNPDEKKRKAPDGWRNVGTTQTPELMTTKDADKEEARREKVGAPDQDEMQADADEADTEAKEKKRKEKEEADAAAAKAGETETGDDEDEDEPETDDTPEDEPEPEAEPEKEPDVSTKPEDHIHKYKSADDIPDGVNADDVKKIEKDTLQGDEKKAEAYMKRWGLQSPPDGFKYYVDPGTHKKSDRIVPVEKDKDQGARRRTKTTYKAGGGKTVQRSSYLRTFGEFIAEDVMSDLKKVTKSKSDSEISLDDGNDIPIDPLTAEILVKYIEGLGSSEKNKTIKQIQRTERAFMKVLGKAHGA